ncbi:unnamed protein product [Heligmosomoides polygyrus]|uniref:Biogenesis of lysosome-related organelles complex 1 subunit 7 n=1 Tax=Heligmosomoides polygyrus TaxID=6339 RepID=A0A3P7YWE8_HELPZ|nr:unnamed protein product [Heligmosomoides polygyrus]
MASSGPCEVTLDSGDLMFASMGSLIESLEEQIRSARGAQLEMNSKINEMAEVLYIDFSRRPVDIYSYCGAATINQGFVHDRLSRVQRLIAREIYKRKKMIKENEVPASPER